MFWYAAYISQASTQFDLKDGVLKTIRSFVLSVTGFLQDDEFNGLYQYAALEWNLLAISPVRDGYIGVWGTTPRFLQNIFQENKYSGIILELEDDKDYSYWSYKVLEKGMITDWFVSNPRECFDSWKIDSIQKILQPYIADRTKQDDLHIDSLDDLTVDVFTGRPEVLEKNNLVEKGVFVKDVATSFMHYRTVVSFTSFLSNLKVPYHTLELNPFNFGIYLDVKSKRIDLGRRTELVQAYGSISLVKDLNSFTFVLFDLKESDYPTLFVY